MDDCFASLGISVSHAKEIAQKEFQRLTGKMEALSPLGVLARGYSMTFLENSGKLLRKAEQAQVGSRLRTRLAKSCVFSEVTKVEA